MMLKDAQPGDRLARPKWEPKQYVEVDNGGLCRYYHRSFQERIGATCPMNFLVGYDHTEDYEEYRGQLED